jgi:hypothetical protein
MNKLKQKPRVSHTPGPWSADKWAPGYSVSAPDSHHTICNLTDCNNAEANARLIAAAPELLEALKGLRDRAAKDAETYAQNGNESIWAFISDATDAIAKAEAR